MTVRGGNSKHEECISSLFFLPLNSLLINFLSASRNLCLFVSPLHEFRIESVSTDINKFLEKTRKSHSIHWHWSANWSHYSLCPVLSMTKHIQEQNAIQTGMQCVLHVSKDQECIVASVFITAFFCPVRLNGQYPPPHSMETIKRRKIRQMK